MFGDIANPQIRVGSQKWYTVPLSILLHVVLVGAVVIVPLMAADILPTPPTMMAFVAAPPPPPPPPASVDRAPPPEITPDAAPVQAPEQITAETGITIDTGIVGGVEGGVAGGIVGGVVGGLDLAPPPPPPPPAEPIRVGGNIRPPAKTRDVAPIYPAIAQSARVQGIVIIEATIGADGRVTDATVLRSIPLLDSAALTAVRQWEFSPTLLNGIPVPVIMTVTVNFTLQ